MAAKTVTITLSLESAEELYFQANEATENTAFVQNDDGRLDLADGETRCFAAFEELRSKLQEQLGKKTQ